MAPSWSAIHRQQSPRLRSAIAPAAEPAESSSNAEAADAQSPSSAQPIARSNDSRKASATPSGTGRSRYGFFSQAESCGVALNEAIERAIDRPCPGRRPTVGQLQVLQRGDREARPGTARRPGTGPAGPAPADGPPGHRREPLLELGDGRVGALGLQQQPGHEDRPAQMAGVLLEQDVQGRLRGVEPLEMDLDDGLPRQEPGVVREPGQALLQRLERRFELAALHHPLGALGVGFDLMAAPLELLTAAARAGRYRGRPTPF